MSSWILGEKEKDSSGRRQTWCRLPKKIWGKWAYWKSFEFSFFVQSGFDRLLVSDDFIFPSIIGGVSLITPRGKWMIPKMWNWLLWFLVLIDFSLVLDIGPVEPIFKQRLEEQTAGKVFSKLLQQHHDHVGRILANYNVVRSGSLSFVSPLSELDWHEFLLQIEICSFLQPNKVTTLRLSGRVRIP